MPYDPAKAQQFRKSLRELGRVWGLTPGKLADLFDRALRQQKRSELSLPRSTLERFIGRKNVPGKLLPSKNPELEFLYETLRLDTRYRRYLAEPQGGIDEADGRLLPAALAGFFSGATHAHHHFPLNDMRACFAGEYIMFRRDRDRGAPPDSVRVSTVNVTVAEDGIQINEHQDFQQPGDPLGHRQYDTGYLFTYVDYMFFIMRETTGTAVKFGMIEDAIPNVGQSDQGNFLATQYFEGYIAVASRRARPIFPLTRFACVRYRPSNHAHKSGLIRLSEVPDARAVGYIQNDFRVTSIRSTSTSAPPQKSRKRLRRSI